MSDAARILAEGRISGEKISAYPSPAPETKKDAFALQIRGSTTSRLEASRLEGRLYQQARTGICLPPTARFPVRSTGNGCLQAAAKCQPGNQTGG